MMTSKAITALKQTAMKTGMNRRDFMQTATATGLAAGVSALAWSEVEAATPKKGGTLRLGAEGGSTQDSFNPLQGERC